MRKPHVDLAAGNLRPLPHGVPAVHHRYELIIRILLEQGDITSHLSFQWNLKTCAVRGNLAQLFGRPHNAPHREPAKALQRRLENELDLGRRPKARREAKVAALDVALDITKTLMGQPCSQIRHLDESSTDVDRAQESDVGRHQNVNVPRPTSRTVPRTKIVPAPSTARSRTEGRPIALPWWIRRRSPTSPLATNQPPRLAQAEPVAGSSMTAPFWVKKRRASMVLSLIYTSDAADDLLCVDLGGRRIIKKK